MVNSYLQQHSGIERTELLKNRQTDMQHMTDRCTVHKHENE